MSGITDIKAAADVLAEIAISERERGALKLIMSRPGTWGGAPDALLLQASIWEALRMDDVTITATGAATGVMAADTTNLSGEHRTYWLDWAALPMLRALLAPPGMDVVLGLMMAKVLRRLPTGGPS